MSLILDALKKSEAERNRGTPPRLHTPYVTVQRERPAWIVPTITVAILAAGGATWLSLTTPRVSEVVAAAPDSAPDQPVAAVPVGESQMPVTAQMPGTDPTPELTPAAVGGAGMSSGGGSASLAVPQRADLYTPPQTPSPQTVQTAPPAQAPAPAAPLQAAPAPPIAAQPEPAPVADNPLQIAPAVDVQTTQQTVSVAATAETSVQTPSAEAPQEQLLLVYQLPYAIRKDLPKLDLSMHVFSPVREERFVVLNGKRYGLDGTSPGPDIALLDISDEGAVMEFRGQKFLLPRQTF